jgi:multiple sugar transport system permease protein
MATRRRARRALLHLLLVAIAVVMVAPFYWMTITALKPTSEAIAYPPTFFPERITFGSVGEVLTRVTFLRYTLNTLVFAAIAVAGELVFAALAAYAFARLRFPGRDAVFFAYLGTMMIPFYITMIPAFLVVKWLGLVNTFAALILPRLASPFGTFLLRQYFLTIPREIEDAAAIDGCSRPGFLFRILLPLSTPALAALALLLFMQNWNAFLWPLLVANRDDVKVLQLALSDFRNQNFPIINLVMAGTLLSVLPILAVFFAAQKHFVQGVVMSGLKG